MYSIIFISFIIELLDFVFTKVIYSKGKFGLKPFLVRIYNVLWSLKVPTLNQLIILNYTFNIFLYYFQPIFLPGQNGDHKLNVEEKKTRVRHPMDGSRISEGGNSMAGGRNGGQGNNIGNGVGTGNANGNGNNGNRGGNNGQSGSGGNGGSIMMRGGGTGGGMPRGGARGGFGGGRGEGRGGGNMSRGTGYRRN